MAQYVSQPDETSGTDTTLYEGAPNTNYETLTLFQLGKDSASKLGRGLLKFDLSSIPTDATVDSATLEINSQGIWYGDTIYLQVYRILSGNDGWTESGATWNKKDGTNNYAGSVGCSTSGTDYSSTLMGSADITGTGIYTVTLNTSEMELMIDNNYGFLLRTNSDVASNQTNISTASDTTEANRPKLTVNYTEAGGDSTPVILFTP